MQVHFISIGGSVMHNLALALAAEGHHITGSDDAIHDPAHSQLLQAGLLPDTLGWHPEKLHKNLDAVIVGMHAQKENPELQRAQELGLRLYSFPEFVFEHSRNKQRIVIAGSHGKTTITSMVMHVLRGASIDFDYLVGAQVQGFERTVRLSKNAPMIIIEGDEYTTSPIDPRPKFLVYQPHIVVLSGIAWDHINVFPTEGDYIQAFRSLLQILPKAGTVIYNSEDERVSELVWRLTDSELHYRIPYETPAYKARDGRIELKLNGYKGETLVYGQHNMSNLAAAHWVCKQFALETPEFLEKIANFKGAGLRLQTLVENDKLVLIRDFAHAPSKVKATVNGVAEFYRDAQVIGVLELHTFSSLNKTFLAQYRNTLKKLDHKIVLVSTHTRELKKMPQITEEEIRRAFHDNSIIFVQTRTELAKAIHQSKAFAKSDMKSIVLLMSSGGLEGLAVTEII